MVKVANDGLYQLYEGTAYPIHENDILFARSEAPSHRLWEKAELRRIRQLVSAYPLEPYKNYYVLIARDQTFSQCHMRDFRCH